MYLTIAESGFIVLTIAFVGLLVQILKKAVNRTSWSEAKKKRVINGLIGSLIIWFLFVTIWSVSGLMSDFSIFPLNFAPVLVIPFATIVLLCIFSSNLSEMLNQVNPSTILYLQSFRVFVELILWLMVVGLIIPIQMSFEGRNFDIFVGLTGPLMGLLVSKGKVSKSGLITWNIVGLGILTNIVAIAMLSTPTPIRMFFNEPANTIVATFPSVLLPAFLVPLAYTLHFFSIKQALSAEGVKQLEMNRA